MIAGFGLGVTPRVITPPPTYSGIPMGLIRWDAFSRNSTLSWWTSSGLSKFYGTSAKYNCRRPRQWDNAQQWGAGVDTQKVMDAELAFCKNKLDHWIYDWYPPDSIVVGLQQSNIIKMFEAHFASAIKSNVKFSFLLQGGWYAYPAAGNAAVWPNATAYTNWILDKMNDPNYMRIDGKPLVVVYNDTTSGTLNWTPAHWNDFKAITGPVYGLATSSIPLMTSLGLQGYMTYGPNGAQVTGTGEKAVSALQTIDRGHWNSTFGSSKTISTTLVQDARPKNTAAAYVDKYTQPTMLAFVLEGLATTSAKQWVGYAHSELSEGGPGTALTFQEGSRHYDCLFWARGGARPARYTYELSCRSATLSGANSVIMSGTWAYQFPDPSGIQGAHDNDEIWTSTAGASTKLNLHDRLQSVTLIGSTLVGGGTATIKANGFVVGTADFNGASAVRQAIFTWDFNDNPPVSGTFEVICDGTGQIRPDSYLITYKP